MSSVDELLAMPSVTEGTLVECAQRLRDARMARVALDEVIAMLEMELPARMEDDSIEVPGVGVLRRQRKRSTTWADERAAGEFRKLVADTAINKVALNVATGELDPTIRQVGRAVVDKLWEYVPSFSSVKAAGKHDGIDVDEYRTHTDSFVAVIDTLEGEPWR